jgi:hypothetical protein
LDSSEDMPAFGKPEEIPLVVPDLTPVVPATPEKRRCKELNKAGNPCSVPPLKGGDRCLGHAKSLSPELRAQWGRKGKGIPKLSGPISKKADFKSREDILGILSHRLDLVTERYGEMSNPEVEEMICNLCRTIATVMRVETAETASVPGWRMAVKGTG